MYKLHYYRNEFEVNVTTLAENERVMVPLAKIDRIVLGWSHPVFQFLLRKPGIDRCFTLYQGEIGFPMKLRNESTMSTTECCQLLKKIQPKIQIVSYEEYTPPVTKEEQDVRWMV